MEAAAAAAMSSSSSSSSSFSVPSAPKFEPDTEAIKRRLLKKGVYPTPKIIHTLRKKEIQKHNRKLNKLSQTQQPPPLTPSQKQALLEESHFQTLKREYRDFTKAVTAQRGNDSGGSGLLVGKPWERIEKVNLKEIASGYKEFSWGKLKRESLRDLKEIFEGNLRWVLEEGDVEVEEDWFRTENQEKRVPARRRQSEGEAIRCLVERLSNREVTLRDWKLAKVMKQSGLRFDEGQLLKMVEGLGDRGKWEQAVVVVEWVYNDKDRRDCKSRYVYTKLLSVLGKARRPREALGIFNLMREDCNIYPDMAAYHTIAVTLGQTGLLKELMKIIEYMSEKPSKKCKNFRHRSWDPVLEPDMVIYNAVLNACVPSKQWKGVSWVFEQLRKNGLRPNGATYGLAMEVMLHSGKCDLVHELFRKMNRSGEAPKALTYKVLVKAFWEEGKVNEAVEAVRDMEQRGVVGRASVYYELACCLCHYGRWQDAMLEVKKIKRIRDSKPLEVTFTGMILSSLDGGYVDDCISIFKHMKACCVPNIGTINIMLKVFGQNDLFSEAKQLFEEIKGGNGDGASCIPDKHTYSSMLEASASALQWEYFEHVYKEMVFSGYRVDQSKHALVLVRASRAGKTHILEHAFDVTLEAGEVPHPLFFTELVFQAAVQGNYERAISLVNAIGHAPFQISERQWRNVFARNRDKLSQDCLEKLLDALLNCGVASEVSVSNLSKSLHSLCGCDTSSHLPVSVASPVEDIVYPSFDINNKRVDLPNFSLSRMEGKTKLDGESLVGKPYDKSNADTCSSNAEGEDMDAESSLQNAAGRLHRTSSMSLGAEVSTDGMASHASVDDPENKLSDFILDRPWVDDGVAEFRIPVSQVDDSQESELPSAYEILDAWKESRREDGIFFPYQLGLK